MAPPAAARSLLRLARYTRGFSPCTVRACGSAASSSAPLRVCVVGSGPAGCYAAASLARLVPTATIDVIEALPVPYGLVRAGVAPDHPEVKVVQHQFDELFHGERPSAHFFGNVSLGRDVSLAELREMYCAVILAYGAAADRRLGIPGEDAAGVASAREFVNWYNGHPEAQFGRFEKVLQSTDTAVIVGQGNVAVDCARMLLRDVDELRKTDMPEHAIDALAQSRVTRVVLVGRRGPLQLAATNKELRELSTLTGADLLLPREHVEMLSLAQTTEAVTDRARKRLLQLLRRIGKAEHTASRRALFAFQLSPTHIDVSESGSAQRIHMQPLALSSYTDPSARAEAERAQELERALGPPQTFGDGTMFPNTNFSIDTGLILTSIGYRSLPAEGAPFDEHRGRVREKEGRVVDDDGAPVRGLYATGWLRRGPSGIIGTNKWDADETIRSLVEDIGHLPIPHEIPSLGNVLRERGVSFLSFADWKRLDDFERAQGAQLGKPREKVTNVAQMLAVARA